MVTENRYLSNTFYAVVFFVLQSLVTFWSSPLIINSVGKQHYGIIVLVNTLSVFGWLSLIDFGLQGALTKHLAGLLRDGDSGREKCLLLFQSSLFLYLVFGAIAGSVVFLCAIFPDFFLKDALQHELLSRAFIVVALFNLVIFPLMPFLAIAEGLQKYRAIKFISAFTLLCWAVIIYIISTVRMGVLYFIIADYTKTLIQYILIIILIKKNLPWLRINMRVPKFEDIKSLANLSIDLFVSRITGLVFNQTDVLLITFIIGQSSVVSDYHSANVIFMSLLGIAAVFNSVVVSQSVWLYSDSSMKRLLSLAEVGTRVTSSYLLPIMSTLFVWAPEILKLWLGPDFQKNGWLLRILLLAIIPVSSSGITSTILIGIDRLRGSLWIPIMAVLINLTVSLLGIKSYGIIALGTGTTVAYIIGSILYNRYFLGILKSSNMGFYRVTMVMPLSVSIAGGAIGFIFKEFFSMINVPLMISIIVVFVFCHYGIIYLFSTQSERHELLAVIGLSRFVIGGRS